MSSHQTGGEGGLLRGRVALVTGAASGIGYATSCRLAREGATVIAIDRSIGPLVRTAPENVRGGRIEPFQCDVTDHAGLERCVSDAVGRHGKVDILVNNAGISFYSRHVNSTLVELRTTLAVNFEAMYVLAKLTVPHMVRQRYGRIVNIASTQALAAEATVGAYAASKGAIVSWSRSLAVDLAEHGILVNVVAPGCIHTPMSVVNGVDETETDLFKQWYVGQRKIPLARAGQPAEIANAILFLAGDQCTYITGQVLIVDGGLTATF